MWAIIFQAVRYNNAEISSCLSQQSIPMYFNYLSYLGTSVKPPLGPDLFWDNLWAHALVLIIALTDARFESCEVQVCYWRVLCEKCEILPILQNWNILGGCELMYFVLVHFVLWRITPSCWWCVDEWWREDSPSKAPSTKMTTQVIFTTDG